MVKRGCDSVNDIAPGRSIAYDSGDTLDTRGGLRLPEPGRSHG